jgi:ketosteroid isomerase-like protein
MTEDIVEMVRSSYDGYRRGDLEAMLRHTDPEIVVYRDEPDGATFHGHEGLMQAIAEWVEDFDEFEFIVEDVTRANDRQVIAQVHQRAVGAGSGVEIEGDFWFVHSFEGGKVVRFDMFASRDQALEATGNGAG